MNSFFDENKLNELVPYEGFQLSALVSSDSYDEQAIYETIRSLGSQNAKLLQQCAIQIAIIGAGNRSFGAIRIDDDEIVPLTTVFHKCGVKYENIVNAKLGKGDLTPRRLVRFYRHCTKAFIKQHDRPSYLWVKYSNHNLKYKDICFPGAEHLVRNVDEYAYICEVYRNLDKALGTEFSIRLQRVGTARGFHDASIL